MDSEATKSNERHFERFLSGTSDVPFYFSVCTSFILLHVDRELELWPMGVIVSVHYFKMNQ